MTDEEIFAAMQAQYAMSDGLLAYSFGSPERTQARASTAPQPMYADLAAHCPVEHHAPGMYSAYSMEDVLFLNKHHEVRQGVTYLGSTRAAIPLGLDGEEHRKYRRLLDPVFAPRRIASLEGQIRQYAHEMIDAFIDTGSVEAYKQWCELLPSTVFLSIMGLPMKDRDSFIGFKNRILGTDRADTLTPEQIMGQRMEAVIWMQNYFTEDLDAREQEATQRDDMTSWLLNAEVDGERLGRQEVLDILGLLMIAGLDTVAGSLACFLSFLARHPEHRARIVTDPSVLPSAVEELMRVESPVVEGTRRVVADLTLPSGTMVPAGSYIMVSWAGCNADAAAFPNPLEVDFDRNPNAHIGFASGFHRCLGSHLARMELRVAMEVWHERLPDYAVADGVELTYSGNPRAPRVLPLVWN